MFIFVFEEVNLRVCVCDEFLWELGVEVRPRQASVLACVLAGTSEGTSESKSSSVNSL